MVRVIDPRADETVYDPSCGKGGFLAQSFEHMTGPDNQKIQSAEQLDNLKEVGSKEVGSGLVFTHVVRKCVNTRPDPFSRQVIRVMVQVIDPRADETVYDSCCGTGGFLAQSFEHMTGPDNQKIQSAEQLDNLKEVGSGLVFTHVVRKCVNTRPDPFSLARQFPDRSRDIRRTFRQCFANL